MVITCFAIRGGWDIMRKSFPQVRLAASGGLPRTRFQGTFVCRCCSHVSLGGLLLFVFRAGGMERVNTFLFGFHC